MSYLAVELARFLSPDSRTVAYSNVLLSPRFISAITDKRELLLLSWHYRYTVLFIIFIIVPLYLFHRQSSGIIER